ncbi:MAG: hypothetical protein K6G88_09585 [Lachnospiraceae bacterium]|nr:hypothetical protein [Lachnospiraceae bacterium]
MEKDLFDPIKSYFESYGYVCDGEVNDIDLYMEKDGSGVAVELKVTLDFKSVRQAALRQKMVDTVFIGIFRPRNLNSRDFKDKIYLLKRLGIGLIVVSKRTHTVEIVSEPIVSDLSVFRKNNTKKKRSLSEEFQRRKVKNNTGGVTHAKIITGYREDALLVLSALSSLGGTSSTKDIREISKIKNSTSILYANYYGWFNKEGRGTYSISKVGVRALEEYSSIIKKLKSN